MSELARFGISLDKGLLGKFDRLIKKEKYLNRSEAFRDLIREKLVRKEWTASSLVDSGEVAGAVSLVYDHHKRDLLNTLVDIQHDFHHLIIANQHIHLDHHNCLEIIAVKGKPKEVRKLADRLRSTKGVKHSQLTMATTGKELR